MRWSMMASSTLTCKHFGICGGCRCDGQQDGHPAPLPYAEQLASKESWVHAQLQPYTVEAWRPIVPSPEIWHYRNKMELAFGEFGPDGMVLGLRETGRFDRIVDVETCRLMSPEAQDITNRVRAWAKKHGLKGYHRRAHHGDLRYLVLREGKNTGERMGILIVTKIAFDKTAAMLDLTPILQPLFSTFIIGVTDSLGDVARAPDMHLRWGPGYIQERLGSQTFRVSPYSFFQTNTHATEKLYELLREWACPHPNPLPRSAGDQGASTISYSAPSPASLREGGGALLDLYCGSGGIGISMARSFDRLVGIDSNEDAIQDARFNAELNGLGNTEFVATDAEGFLKKLPASKLSVQLATVVVDPPRPGLHPKAMQALLELNPTRIGYVSCNPESLARDLQTLVPFYRIRYAQPIDLFPHTAHVETFVALEHK